jgi:hypothetical protein
LTKGRNEVKPEDFIMMPIPANSFTAVCALLGGAAVAGLAAGNAGTSGAASQGTAGNSGAISETASSDQNGSGSTATTDASHSDGRGLTTVANTDDSGEIDAHGHPWSAELHASTKGKTKDGLWRMKVGVTRPAPLPGFPVDNAGSTAATGTSSGTDTASATSQSAAGQGSGQPATSGDDDDEFAAFRQAAAASDATDAAAAANVPARQYSDADLGALCNQAAVKLGDPSPIKEIIASYTPEGQVAHSRNIPADKRAEFVKAVETKAGIEFAG